VLAWIAGYGPLILSLEASMNALATVPPRDACRARPEFAQRVRCARGVHDQLGSFRLIDAKAAGERLGVPHTWLLAQARAGRIPHHRLGHYVRFNPDGLERWLHETRVGSPLRDRYPGRPALAVPHRDGVPSDLRRS
jgi:excisionase family DNA binding protein